QERKCLRLIIIKIVFIFTNMIKAIFFDVANTILGKQDIYFVIKRTLESEGIKISQDSIKQNHRLVTDLYNFPDKTSADFYRLFNRDFLNSFGIIPSDELIDKIIENCSKLEWSEFVDVRLFQNINNLPLGVLS